ncbi:MAG: HU family DNA-binding protein [Rickettsiales bacterium]
MEKKKILAYLAQKYPNLDITYIESITDRFFQLIAENIKNGDRIEFRNFGIFKLKRLSEREIFNPHTKRLETVSSKSIPFFKCSKSLHKLSA